jgi:hypothetical protein
MRHPDDAPTSAFRDRVGRCYELAATFATEHMGTPGLRLVHGTIQRDPFPKNGHAWVRFQRGADMVVVDPVLGRSPMPHDVYVEWANALVEVEYTSREAAVRMLASGTYGPWHEDDEDEEYPW